jgi:site-specific DNA recombinase
MTRAALYARFSSDNQREESIIAQFRDSTAYCKKKGYIIVRKYADEAKSGTTTAGRDQYLQMLADAKKGLFDVIIFHKIDRNARNEYDYYTTKKLLQDTGIGYEYSRQDIDSTTPEGQMMEAVMVGMSAYYSRNLAAEIKKGLRENAYEGKSTGGRPPYGYTTDREKHIIINEEEAPVIRSIFNMYLSGMGYHEILQRLYDAGYRNRRGKSFCVSSLYEILRNRKYEGTLIIGKALIRKGRRNNHKLNPSAQIFEDVIPPIIDKDKFQEVQNKMNERKTRPGAGQKKNIYALSGLIYCGICGAPMIGHSTTNQKGHKNYYYRCRCARLIGKEKCPSHMIDRDQLENHILEKIKSMFLAPNARQHIKDLITENLKNRGSIDYTEELKRLKRRETEGMKKLDRIYDLIESGDSDDFEQVRLSKAKQEVLSVRRLIEDAENHIQVGTLDEEKVDQIIDLMQRILQQKKNPERIKVLFHLVIDRVTVYNNEIVVALLVSQADIRINTQPVTVRMKSKRKYSLYYPRKTENNRINV